MCVGESERRVPLSRSASALPTEKATERDRERQREAERDRERQGEAERDRERQGETEIDRERRTEADRDSDRRREPPYTTPQNLNLKPQPCAPNLTFPVC